MQQLGLHLPTLSLEETQPGLGLRTHNSGRHAVLLTSEHFSDRSALLPGGAEEQ